MNDKPIIDPVALQLFSTQMETLHCIVAALRAPGGFNEAALIYLLEARLNNRRPDDLTSLGVAQLLEVLQPTPPTQPQRPVLRLIQGGL